MRVFPGVRLRQLVARFLRDTSGVALVYITLALPVLIGFGLLAIDVGRIFSLQASLQHGADALALAGVGELDRRPAAITRVDGVINNLVTTSTGIWWTTIATIDETSIGQPCFFHNLPPNDAETITSPCLADTAANVQIARFVRIEVTLQSFNTIFPATFLGISSNSTSARVSAMAGMDQAVCSFTPMFICNPLEPATGTTDPLTGYGLYTAVASRAEKQRII